MRINRQIAIRIAPVVDPPDAPLSFADAASTLFAPEAAEKIVVLVERNGVEHFRLDGDGTVVLHGEKITQLFNEETHDDRT